MMPNVRVTKGRISTDRLYSMAFPGKTERRRSRKAYRAISHRAKQMFRAEIKRRIHGTVVLP